MPNKSNSFWLSYSVLAGLLLIRFVPLLVGAKYLWGVGHLTLLPSGYAIGYAVVGAIALIIPWLPQAERWGEKLEQWVTRTFFEAKSKFIARGILIAIAAVGFVMFAMPTHFLGDGYSYLANVGSDAGHWVKWSEGGAALSAMELRALIGPPTEANALLAFQIISVISGIITLWFYFLIAGEISDDPWKRLVTLVTLLLSSSIILFFGYVESYPILWGPVAGFMYFSLRYSKEGKGLVPALAFLLVAVLLHLQAAMFLPAAAFLVLSRGKGRKLYDRFAWLVWVGVGAITIAVLVYAYRAYTTDLSVEDIFLYPFSGKPRYPNYAVFSAKHLADILNLFLLVYPVGAAVMILALGDWKERIRNSTTLFFGLLSVGSLLFLFLIDPGLAMPRDWDLFSSCWIAPMLLILWLMPNRTTGAVRRLGVSIILSSIVFLAPFLLVNLDEQRGVAEIRQIIENNPEKSFGSRIILGTYYQNKGNREAAEASLAKARESYPDFYKTKDAFELLAAGRVDEAYRLFSQTKPDKFSKDYHSFLAGYYILMGRADDGLREALAAVQLQKYFDRSYSTLAYAYLLKGDRPKALQALREGYTLNSRNKEFLAGLALMNIGEGHPDSTLYYAEKFRQVDSTGQIYHFLCAQAYFNLDQKSKAREEALLYYKLGAGESGYQKNCADLQDLMPELVAP